MSTGLFPPPPPRNEEMDTAAPPMHRAPQRPHRRSRSVPTDIMQALRAERAEWGGMLGGGTAKRDLSPFAGAAGASPAFKKHAPEPAHAMPPGLFSSASFDSELLSLPGSDDALDGLDEVGKGCSKKSDVPMWTVEEDLLILQLVEKHGKRWSKIAAQLPGRTDNGVRNRWNRMERAQVLRQSRGPEAGYRCRRCGQPKRGHICAALTLGDTPEGDELLQKAEALSKLSANRMRPSSSLSAESLPDTPVMAPSRAASPTPLLLSSEPHSEPRSAEFDEAQLDDFLEELQLHELEPEPVTPSRAAAAAEEPHPAMLSQASLHQLLQSLSTPEGVFMPQPLFSSPSPSTMLSVF